MDARYPTDEQCPLCGNLAATFSSHDPVRVSCQVCGQFQMSFELSYDRDIRGKIHPYLSAATRKAHKAGRPLNLDLNNWQELENEQRSIRVSAKLNDLLWLIAENTGTPGQSWEIKTDSDYPLIAAKDPSELEAYLLHLKEQGRVSHLRTNDGARCALTIPGWQELEPLPRPGGIPGRCFVAMWFSDQTRAAYESGIEPAISDAFQADSDRSEGAQ